MNRRHFLSTAAAAIAAAKIAPSAGAASAATAAQAAAKGRFRTGLVAYSYQKAFGAKTMKYEDLFPIVVDSGADGIDLTSYWLPVPPTNDYLLSLRQLAWKNRIEIYSIGTRVQLAQYTPEAREKQLADVRKWVDVAERLGASHIRIFGGSIAKGGTMEQAVAAAAETLKAAGDIAGERGIHLGVEDDSGITVFAKDTVEIVKQANHPWAGMNLDIGNFHPPNVYDQIKMSIPYAVSTHFKTTVANDEGGGRSPFDWDRVFNMFIAGGYNGYVGLEFEATTEDPAVAVPVALKKLRSLAVKYSV